MFLFYVHKLMLLYITYALYGWGALFGLACTLIGCPYERQGRYVVCELLKTHKAVIIWVSVFVCGVLGGGKGGRGEGRREEGRRREGRG